MQIVRLCKFKILCCSHWLHEFIQTFHNDWYVTLYTTDYEDAYACLQSTTYLIALFDFKSFS